MNKEGDKSQKIIYWNTSDMLMLKSIASNQLKFAKMQSEGHQFRGILPSMVFSVFSVEAICNLYGGQLFNHWDHFETSSFIGKIILISDFLDIDVDFSKEPWQTIELMKKFRNTIAHSKIHDIEKLKKSRETFPYTDYIPKQSSQQYSTISNAEKFINVSDELDGMFMWSSKNKGYEIQVI